MNNLFKQLRIIIKNRFFAFFFLIFLLSPLATFAAILSIDAPSNVSVGERVAVDILLDPENQSINSIESTINFSTDTFSFNGFSSKQSSIPIWVNEPKEKIPGKITFSGVVPGGLDRIYDPLNSKNKSIPIIRLFFISKKIGFSDLSFSNSLVLENDGKGTSVPVTTKSTRISIDGNIRDPETPLTEDKNSPEPFNVKIVERSVFGRSPKLAIFEAQDNEGGIDHYEASVGNLGFQQATSPFALPYRLFDYPFTVRAFDFSGNFREQQITVKGENTISILFLVIILIGSVFLLRFRFYKRNKKDENNI